MRLRTTYGAVVSGFSRLHLVHVEQNRPSIVGISLLMLKHFLLRCLLHLLTKHDQELTIRLEDSGIEVLTTNK